jgi:prepilin-type N-terminal cleavage/methylation domain-containing protein
VLISKVNKILNLMEVEIMKRRSGFTLIEMMIVLAIIAALAAILTPMGTNALNRAKATQYLADVRNIATAAQVYNMDKSTPLATLSALDDGYLDTRQLSIPGVYAASMTSASTLTIGISGISSNLQSVLEGLLPTSYATADTSDISGNYFIQIAQ